MQEILNIQKEAQEFVNRWERTELRNRADKEQLERLEAKIINLKREVAEKKAALELAEAEDTELRKMLLKQEAFMYDNRERYWKEKELASDEVVKKLLKRLERQTNGT